MFFNQLASRARLGLKPLAALLLAASGAAHANLIINGGFENNFDDWSINDQLGVSFISGFVHSGSSSAAVNPTQSWPVLMTSNVFATQAGTQYAVDFWLAADVGLGTNSIAINFGSSQVAVSSVPLQQFNQYQFVFTADSSSTALSFSVDTGDGTTFYIDDVSVTLAGATPPAAVPEPASLALVATGLVGVVAARRRRQQRG